jgi:N-formylglutamate deformylase
MSKGAFTVTYPEKPTSCVVFASPHSGREYRPGFLRQSILNGKSVRTSEDAFVDLLFETATEYGAPFLRAEAPRAFVDLNRNADELDPALVEGVRRQGHNPRIASGLGVIPRVVAGGRAIYSGKISRREADRRLAQIWHPYHQQLQDLLDAARKEHGQTVLIDCHSMPHEAMEGVAWRGTKRPEIVLGDRFGASANANMVDRVEAAFVDAGFVVNRNAPFAGAYITQAYGRPTRRQHAIQVEIDRSLYMDEDRIEPHEGFERLRETLRGAIADIAQLGQDTLSLAAE